MIKDGPTKEDADRLWEGGDHQCEEATLEEDLHGEEVALGGEGEDRLDHLDHVLEEDLLWVGDLDPWEEEVLSSSWDQQTLHL